MGQNRKTKRYEVERALTTYVVVTTIVVGVGLRAGNGAVIEVILRDASSIAC